MKKILLLCGGNSSEHEISKMSAKSIENSIDKTNYEVNCVVITQDNKWLEDNSQIDNIVDYLKQFDVVFPILHGKNGEDGTIQGMLDLFGIPYVGSKCGASYICMDKERTKQILNDLHYPQLPFQTYDKNKLEIPFPIIIKPANGGSSIGIYVANNKKEYRERIKLSSSYDHKLIIEPFISMRELECAVLENKDKLIMNIGEIKSANHFYDYEAKYENKNSKTIVPANIPQKIDKLIKHYAKNIFQQLELKSLARIDFFYDEENQKVYINEINTIPGFTSISMFPKLIMDKGYTYQEVITMLIENAK